MEHRCCVAVGSFVEIPDTGTVRCACSPASRADFDLAGSGAALLDKLGEEPDANLSCVAAEAGAKSSYAEPGVAGRCCSGGCSGAD